MVNQRTMTLGASATIRRVAGLCALLAVVSATAFAQRGDDASRASKNGKTTGTIDGVEVTIEYGRPQVKGRDVWGKLVPWGQVWRTGADEATTITFSAPVKIEGKALAAGTYALFTIPGESQWTVIFNSVPKQWGAFRYDQSKDVLRVDVKPKAVPAVEAMDFAIEGSQVVLRWEKVGVPFGVEAAG